MAHQLIYAKALEIGADLLVVPEPNKNITKNKGWIADINADVAIYIMNKKVCINKIVKKEGHVLIKIGSLAIIACYISPNISLMRYKEQVENIIRASQTYRDFILAGDVNAKSIIWGSPRNDHRGEMWNDWIFANDLVVLNNGKPTFVRGESRSHIDITLVNESYARKIAGWEVLEDNLYTFHRYIVFETGIKVSKIGRKKEPFNKEAYTRQISNLQEDDTTEFQDFRQKIINAYTSSSTTENVTYTVPYWWNDEIQSKRAECFRLRRTAQRYRTPQHTENYKRAKKELGREIKRAKHSCWHNLCTALEDDVWGEAYRIVTKTLRTETPYNLCAKKTEGNS
ncbi:uncharacterized protein [Diabrotica undecimpunctata]|uniref:uncharacterized protein n=1 Tax=Diabrotica undecimpunctata TaxID=50387 RepID=UPI003B6342B4